MAARLQQRLICGSRECRIESEGASDLHVPETGQERVVATAQSLLIATCGDQDGDVLIEIRRDGAVDDGLGTQVFEGEMSFSSPRLVFGSSLGGELGSVDIGGIGWVALKVYVEPAEAPEPRSRPAQLGAEAAGEGLKAVLGDEPVDGMPSTSKWSTETLRMWARRTRASADGVMRPTSQRETQPGSTPIFSASSALDQPVSLRRCLASRSPAPRHR